MKSGTLTVAMCAVALAACLRPGVGWSTRIYASVVTGALTAAPQAGEIEIAHRLYRVKAGSAAAKALGGLSVGQKVDAVVDAPHGKPAEVVSFTAHPGS